MSFDAVTKNLTPPKPYETSVTEWMADRQQKLHQQQQQSTPESVLLQKTRTQQQLIDLTQNQKQRKLKRPFYTSSRMLDDQPICNLSSIQNNMAQSPSHTCKDCLRSFKDINNYKEHRFQEHKVTDFPNIRQCKMCSYATLLKSKYDCHMRCHLNNKVIKCQRCNYSTINIRHMSKHERLHMITIKNSKNGSLQSDLTENNFEANKNQNDNFKRKTNDNNQQSDITNLNNTSNAMYELELIANNKKSRNQSDTMESSDATAARDRELEINRNFCFLPSGGSSNDVVSRSKQSLNDETCSTHSSSSLVTPPWSSSSVSVTSSQSPPLMEQSPPPPPSHQLTTKAVTITSSNGPPPKTFHNILNLIDNNSKESVENSPSAINFLEQQPHGIVQPHLLQQSSFEESFRSNFENLIKLQLSSNLNASNFYGNLVNHHYQQNHLAPAADTNNLNHTSLFQQQHHANPSTMYSNAQAHRFITNQDLNNHNTKHPDSCDQKTCNHQHELANLRENILKLLHGIMPQYVSMSGLENFEDSSSSSSSRRLMQIDRMVDSLVQQMTA